ncbi:MAG TPA: YbaK/EbsC family protein [Euzebyales bacterium]|nr:YbaK/EbsC family protein [Euzebyales bacterium]
MEQIDIPGLEAQVLDVARALDPAVEAIHIAPEAADTATFCARYGYSLEESGNCIVVRSKTGDLRYAACLVQATRQLDLNRHARLLVDARKASFATAEETVDVTGMVPGGVTPFGLPEDLPVFVDAPIMDLERVIVGGGGRGLKLRLQPDARRALATVRVAEIGRDRPPL